MSDSKILSFFSNFPSPTWRRSYKRPTTSMCGNKPIAPSDYDGGETGESRDSIDYLHGDPTPTPTPVPRSLRGASAGKAAHLITALWHAALRWACLPRGSALRAFGPGESDLARAFFPRASRRVGALLWLIALSGLLLVGLCFG